MSLKETVDIPKLSEDFSRKLSISKPPSGPVKPPSTGPVKPNETNREARRGYKPADLYKGCVDVDMELEMNNLPA